MNKILYIIITGIILTSCSNYLDVNDDTNVSTDSSVELVLPAS